MKWQWRVDLTKPEDNFDDAEVDDRRTGLRQAIADGYEWTRDEERAGKWLGLFIAIVFWAIILVTFIATRPSYPGGWDGNYIEDGVRHNHWQEHGSK